MPGSRIPRPPEIQAVNAIAAIEAKVGRCSRRDHVAREIAPITDPARSSSSSRAAESAGRVAGFMLGDACFGEFGIPEKSVTIDSPGGQPDCQHKRLARELVEPFTMNMKAAGTLVNRDVSALERCFARHRCALSERINLEYVLP